MPSPLPPVPHMIPLYNEGGFLNPVWADFFQKAFFRMGGTVAETNDELSLFTTDRIAANSITESKINTSVAGSGIAGGGGSPLSVNTDGSTIEISGDTLRIKDLGVSTAKIANDAVSFIKLLSTDWTKSLASSGYQKLASGLFIQWGVTASIATGVTGSTNFPTAFPTACLQVVAGVINNSAVATTSTGQWGTGNYSTSAFDLYNRTSVSLTFNYLAVGY